MKRNEIVCFLSIFLLFVAPLFGQTWRSSESLGIAPSSSFPGGYGLDLYTNRDGNHLIIREDDSIEYYLFSYDGTQIRSTTIASSLSEEGGDDNKLAQITGWGNKIYIIYIEGGSVHVKRSTNAGQSWSTLTPKQMNYNLSNGLQVWSDEDGVHTVWSEGYIDEDEYYHAETYYALMEYDQTSFSNFKHVTDVSEETGGFPSVTTSENRVYVAYTPGGGYSGESNYGLSRVREKISGSWQAPSTSNEFATNSFLAVAGNQLHKIYYGEVTSSPVYWRLLDSYRAVDGSSWSTPERINSAVDPDYTPVDFAVTNNAHLHYVIVSLNDPEYRCWDGNDWTSTYDFTNSDVHSSLAGNPQITGNGNDVYVVWYASSELKLRQLDSAPIAPTDLTFSNQNNNPYLEWKANPEADLQSYEVYRRTKPYSGQWSSWEKKVETTNTYWRDNGFHLARPGTAIAEYYVKAKDQMNNISAASNILTVYGDELGLGLGSKRNLTQTSLLIPRQFSLSQNTPNPFNPTTIINYQLPETTPIRLVIYDFNGREVFRFSQTMQSAGWHQIQWDGRNNAGELVSTGVYFYRLSAGDFVDVKKMVFMK